MEDKKVIYLWLLLLIMGLYSSFMVGSASFINSSYLQSGALKLYTDYFWKHIFFILIGFSVAYLFSYINLSKLSKYSPVFLILTLTFGLAPIISGILHKNFLMVDINPPYRWLIYSSSGASIQLSEFGRFTLVLYLASVLSDNKYRHSFDYSWKFIYPVILSLLYIILLFFQQHLSAIILTFSIIGALLFFAGVPLRKLSIIVFLGIFIVILSFISNPYQFKRLKDYIIEDPLSPTAYHKKRAKLAFAKGGIFGKGLGEGTEKLAYLPQKHTEFLLPVIGEELGLIGTLGVMLLLYLFFFLSYRIIRSCNDFFCLLLGEGILVTIMFQVIINIISVSIGPITGLPLPFFSYGGTFTVSTYGSVGFIFAIANSTHYAK